MINFPLRKDNLVLKQDMTAAFLITLVILSHIIFCLRFWRQNSMTIHWRHCNIWRSFLLIYRKLLCHAKLKASWKQTWTDNSLVIATRIVYLPPKLHWWCKKLNSTYPVRLWSLNILLIYHWCNCFGN